MEIRRSYDRLISTIGFPILVRWHLYIESGPRGVSFRWWLLMPWIVGSQGVIYYVGWAGPYLSSWWRHQMETFSVLLALCAGNSPVTGEFLVQRPVTRSFDVFFDLCPGINGWVNNREAGDLRRHRTHCDVIVMWARVCTPYAISILRNYIKC